MFILLKKHNKILAESKQELEKAKQELEKAKQELEKAKQELEKAKEKNYDRFKKINELEENFDKKLEEEVKSNIDWYNKFAEKLLKESEKSDGRITTQLGIFYEDIEYKIARLIIKRYLDKDELIKELNNEIAQKNNLFYQRQNEFNKYIRSLENDTSLYNYFSDKEHHKIYYIAFLEQIDKLKSELELTKQELATQVANNIILKNEINKLKEVK
jgi:uncharacterized protein (DUF3084 family)